MTGNIKAFLLTAAVLIFCLLLFFVFVKPAQDRRKAVEAHAGAVVAESHTNAARDASSVVVDRSQKETTRAQQDAAVEAAIRAGDDPDAGLRGLCQHAASRGQPACERLRQPRS